MKNEYEIRGDITAIFLDRKDGSQLETLIDTSDLQRAMEFQWKWSPHWDKHTKSYYVEGKSYEKGGKREYFSLHRWIMQPEKDYEVDHINHDTLDNKRNNLRILPKGTNQQNYEGARKHNKTSGIRGVSWAKNLNKWRASFRIDGKTYHVGLFDNLDEAEMAIKAARAKYMPYSTDVLEKNMPKLNDVVTPCFESKLCSNNTSGYNGLVFNKRIKKWFGKVQRNGKKITTKHYENKIDAYEELNKKLKLLEEKNENSDTYNTCIPGC